MSSRAGIDVGIGRDDEHDVLGRPVEGDRRQGDRGRRVATHRLEQEGGVRELVADDAARSGGSVTTVMSSVSRRRRRSVAWSRDSSPSSGRKGFGRSGRLSGWSRVPPPPAMMTAYMWRPS